MLLSACCCDCSEQKLGSSNPPTIIAPLPSESKTKTAVLPICYYTKTGRDYENQATRRLVDSITKTFNGVKEAAFSPPSSVLVSGEASALDMLGAQWPQLGCIGVPDTAAGVYKREQCQKDMPSRLAGRSTLAPQGEEGKSYLCAHLGS